MRKVLAPSSGVYERRGSVQFATFYDRRFCGLTPSESLLCVAIVTLVFLRVTLVGAAMALPRHHTRSFGPVAMVRGCGLNVNSPNIAGMSNLKFYSGEFPPLLSVVSGKFYLFTNYRGSLTLFSMPAFRGVPATQPMPGTDFGRRAAESILSREDSIPIISASYVASPIGLNTVPHFTRLSGFGPSLDGLQPTVSTPRLS